jgi:putative transposase
MHKIIDEDECNDTYGRYRRHKALELKKETENGTFPHILGELTIYRIMEKLNMVHTLKRKPNGITKADRKAMCQTIRPKEISHQNNRLIRL